ncbi:TetR family transcriptional regulator [Bacteroidia bacterium]|nr:TetR family transcriptional regulator [Bacteroidia bacterium]
MLQTKNAIINVAKNLFRKMSVHKATMDDIAHEAKMSRRTLYMHFKSKKEIYRYVVEDEVEEINRKLQRAADSKLPPDRKLRLYIINHFNIIDNLTRSNKYIRFDFLFNNMSVEQLRKDIDRKEIELLKGILKEGKESNLFKISDPETFAKSLLLMFKSLEQAFILASSRSRSSADILEYVDLLFYGILKR